MANSFAQLYLLDPSPRARRLFWHLLSVGSVRLDEPDRHQGMDKPGAHVFWVQCGNDEWEIHTVITQVLGRLLKARRVFNLPEVDAPKPLARAVSLVMADPCRDWKVTELAQATGVSRSGLQRMFKSFQHESIHEFLLRMRLDRARQLLCDERL